MRNQKINLLFPRPAESQAERCRRVLAAMPVGTVVLASELRFDYAKATKIAAARKAKP